MITLHGHQDFCLRLVLATLSGKPLRISKIRPDDLEPGLKDYEVSFLRLLEAVTNGSVIEISYTGTTVIYRPGLIIGGSHTHKCPNSRGLGFFAVPLLLLGPFAKKPMSITLQGVTSSDLDIGVDSIRTAIFPIFEKFGIDRQELRIVKRGSAPAGGGEIVLHLPHLVLQAKTVHATNSPNKVAKIRGIAYSTRVSPTNVNRTVEAAKEFLKPLGAETFIYTDAARGSDSGNSPGYGVTVVAETKAGWPIFAEGVASAQQTPEDLGQAVAAKLLEQISLGGLVPREQLPLVLILMVLGKEDVGRIVIGANTLDAEIVRVLRYIKQFWNIEAMITPNEGSEDNELLCTLRGSGFVSASKKVI